MAKKIIKRRHIKSTKEHLKRTRSTATKQILKRKDSFKYKLILQGMGVGAVTGSIVSLYRFAFHEVEAARTFMVAAAAQKVLVALLGIGIVLFALVVSAGVVKREPVGGGSGIPQVEAEMKGKMNANWFQVILAKFIGSLLAIGAGLSLGSEGPSVQLGAMSGKGFSRISRGLRTEERMLMTAGSGAGLAAAFGAPLAGVVFTLEEMHKNFSQEVLLTTMAAAITADCIAAYIFGMKPIFEFTVSEGLPLDRMWLVIVLGIALGIFGVIYTKVTFLTQDVFAKISPAVKRVVIPFVMVMVVAVLVPKALGSGSALIEPVANGKMAATMILGLLVVKFITSMISFGTGLPGGTFLPMLVLGALAGGFFTEAVSPLVGFEETYIQYFVVLGMAGYFSAIVRAPITGIILICEMTGTFSNLLSLSMVSLIAYMVADLIKSPPLYEALTERLVDGHKAKKPNKKNKILIECEVHMGSIMEDQTLSSISLPKGCLVVSILRDGHEIVPHGGTHLEAGDKLAVLCNEDLVMSVQYELEEKCKTLFNNK
ncbi:MAG: ClC family H(+)/Cl(-) exchange transporter [Firmicutes bacterium]|nr:ClC family H(+)/Cl(-) exchange transporter [Bacillota bacterium]